MYAGKLCSKCKIGPREQGNYCRSCFNTWQRAKRRRDVWAKFGVTQERVNQQWELQKGLCALCSKALHRDTPQGCHVDHCHVTNRFRGLLCGTCNTALGALGDTPESLERVLSYVQFRLNKVAD